MHFIKRDNYIFGAVFALILPAALFGLIRIVNFFLVESGATKIILDLKIHLIISIIVNLLPIRYYFVNLKFDKTGRGFLFVTFILMILFFALKDRIS